MIGYTIKDLRGIKNPKGRPLQPLRSFLDLEGFD